MSVTSKKNLCTPREYTDRQGNKKTSWLTIGKIFYTDKGSSFIKVDCIPTGNWDGVAQVFDERNQQEQPTESQSPYSRHIMHNESDDIPF